VNTIHAVGHRTSASATFWDTPAVYPDFRVRRVAVLHMYMYLQQINTKGLSTLVSETGYFVSNRILCIPKQEYRIFCCQKRQLCIRKRQQSRMFPETTGYKVSCFGNKCGQALRLSVWRSTSTPISHWHCLLFHRRRLHFRFVFIHNNGNNFIHASHSYF